MDDTPIRSVEGPTVERKFETTTERKIEVEAV